jgi:serine/threonine protein kinase
MSAPSVYRNALPPQTVLHEYRIEQVLGAGGFGITYRARDTNADGRVSPQEFLHARRIILERRAGKQSN